MTTEILELPELQASQSQPHIIVNTAIRRIEAAINIGVVAVQNAPPASPTAGARYIVGAAPTGAWGGQSNKIAFLMGGGWKFLTPLEGWIAAVIGDQFYFFDGAAWTALATGGSIDASDVDYGNSNSSLAATNVQDAIDEIVDAGLVDDTRWDPRLGYYYRHDFMSVPGSAGADGWDTTAANGGSVNALAAEAGHPGIVRLTTSANASGQAAILHALDGASAAGTGIRVGGGVITVDWLLRFPTLPAAASNVFLRVGLVDELTGLPTDAIYLNSVFDGTVFTIIGICRASGSDTATLTANGFAPSGNTWHHGRIVINAAGNSVEFFVDGNSLGTIASGIPTASLTEAAGYAKSSGDGSSVSMDVDIVQCVQPFSTPRWT
ncbi:MAG: DUF2793 domain-containing protein [Steroidobacteraceae bacterium]